MKKMENAYVFMQIVKCPDAKSRIAIWPILSILKGFWPKMKQYNMNQAINHRK